VADYIITLEMRSCCCYNVPVPKDFIMNQHQYNVFLGLALFVLFTPIVWFIWFVFFRKHK